MYNHRKGGDVLRSEEERKAVGHNVGKEIKNPLVDIRGAIFNVRARLSRAIRVPFRVLLCILSVG